MSAGPFIISRYEATYGTPTEIHPIRVQPETTGAFSDTGINTPPVGDTTSPISAVVTRSRRGLGLHPRVISLRLLNDPPEGYSADSRIRLVCLTENFYVSAAVKGRVIGYLGTQWTVVGFSPEIAA